MKTSYLKYIAALALFGTNGVVASLITLSSYEIVYLRTFIGSLLLVGILVLRRKRPQFLDHKKEVGFIVLSGMAMGACWLFLYEAYQQIGVSLSSLAYYCAPVLVMALSPVLFRERLTTKKIAGFCVVLLGIVLVNGCALQEGLSSWGVFCGLASAAMYAVLVIANKKAVNIVGLENSTIQLTVAFLTVALFTIVRQGPFVEVVPSQWPAVLCLGLVNTGFGCYLYFSAIGGLPVQTVAVCGYLEPLSAVFFSMLLLHEQMLPLQILGAVCIIGGAVFCEVAGLRHRDGLEVRRTRRR